MLPFVDVFTTVDHQRHSYQIKWKILSKMNLFIWIFALVCVSFATGNPGNSLKLDQRTSNRKYKVTFLTQFYSQLLGLAYESEREK